jgi:predicted dienelactone hydrolase
MTVRQAMPLFWKYLFVVATSCLLAFVISTQARASTPVASKAPTTAASAATNTVTRVADTNYAAAGPSTVQVIEETWRDAARGRDVPVRIYAPSAESAPKGKLAVILFSHGLGGSRAGGRAWGEHWASHGFVSVHLQHAGSDESIWRSKRAAQAEADLKGAMTINNLNLRVGDVHYVLDELARRVRIDAGWPWRELDLSRIGMSGHSFGAQTTLAVSGLQSPGVGGMAGYDKRITAAIAFSPNARNKRVLDKQFGGITMPFMSITGTLDGAVLGDGTKPSDRELPFRHMAPGNKYLLVMDGGDHSVFGGHTLGGRRSETARDQEIQADVKAASLAFWNAQLRNDAAASSWLTGATAAEVNLKNSGMRSSLNAADRYEYR